MMKKIKQAVIDTIIDFKDYLIDEVLPVVVLATFVLCLYLHTIATISMIVIAIILLSINYKIHKKKGSTLEDTIEKYKNKKKQLAMTDEYKAWWIHYVSGKTPEGHFYLPLEPKNINDMTKEEFDLLDASEWTMECDNPYGITYFICKKIDDSND